jgi:hypothetical protein
VGHFGVLVHCPCRLCATSTVLAVKLHCGDGVVTEGALKLGKPPHRFDGVISHNFDCSRSAFARLRTKVSPDRAPMAGGDFRKILSWNPSGFSNGQDCLAEEAVWRNFSPSNSLLAGNLTGNFANFRSNFASSSRYRPHSMGLAH